jgi:hypothetical protein
MLTLGLNTVELVSTLRTAPFNGAPSSDDFNDSQKENLADLTSIVSFIDNTLLPLLNSLPDSALLPADAPTGIEGRTVFSDSSDQNTLFYDSLGDRSLTIAESLRLLNGMLESFRTRLEDMGIRVGALQTRLASDNKNDLSLALQNLTNTINQVTASQASLGNRVYALEHEKRLLRQPTGDISPGAVETVEVVWTTPFIDDNYTASFQVEDASGLLIPVNFYYRAPSGSGVIVRVQNLDNIDAHSGTVHAVAFHD